MAVEKGKKTIEASVKQLEIAFGSTLLQLRQKNKRNEQKSGFETTQISIQRASNESITGVKILGAIIVRSYKLTNAQII